MRAAWFVFILCHCFLLPLKPKKKKNTFSVLCFLLSECVCMCETAHCIIIHTYTCILKELYSFVLFSFWLVIFIHEAYKPSMRETTRKRNKYSTFIFAVLAVCIPWQSVSYFMAVYKNRLKRFVETLASEAL